MGFAHDNVSVSRCIFTGSVTTNATEDHSKTNNTPFGGIVGEVKPSATIKDCTVSDSTITGLSHETVGGIYGYVRGLADQDEYNGCTHCPTMNSTVLPHSLFPS